MVNRENTGFRHSLTHFTSFFIWSRSRGHVLTSSSFGLWWLFDLVVCFCCRLATHFVSALFSRCRIIICLCKSCKWLLVALETRASVFLSTRQLPLLQPISHAQHTARVIIAVHFASIHCSYNHNRALVATWGTQQREAALFMKTQIAYWRFNEWNFWDVPGRKLDVSQHFKEIYTFIAVTIK